MRQVQEVDVAKLVPYERNARLHSDSHIDQIAASIVEFGWTAPILVDGCHIIAGHGRHKAAVKLGLDKVPCINLEGLSESQKRAYIIADNKLALNSTWDMGLLADELKALELDDFDMKVIGFSGAELADLLSDDEEEEHYTKKFSAPIYEPSEDKPEVSELVEESKATLLSDQVRASSVSDAEKQFLLLAAQRHAVFNFRKIADYYAHASPEMQNLMECSALVIIDVQKAIENGYVSLTEQIMARYGVDHPQPEPVSDAA